MLLDSRVDRSVVHLSIVEPCEWLGKHIILKGVNGIPLKIALAEIRIHTGQSSIPLVVATLETIQDKVLIGRDIGPVFNDLFMQELVENGKETNDGDV